MYDITKKTSRLAFVANFVLALLAAFGKFCGPLLCQPSRMPQAGTAGTSHIPMLMLKFSSVLAAARPAPPAPPEPPPT